MRIEKTTLLSLLTFLTISSTLLWAQSNAENQSSKDATIIFERLIPATDDVFFGPQSILRAHDGGYIIVGSLFHEDEYEVSWSKRRVHAESFDFWLLKLNQNGEEEWTRTYGGNDADDAFAVEPTSDGGYVLIGRSSSFPGTRNYAALHIKTDANGKKLWQRVHILGDDTQARAIRQTADGGFIIAGLMIQTGDEHSYDAFLLKTDSLGREEWWRAYYTDPVRPVSERTELGEYGDAVQPTSDDGYIMIGSTQTQGAGGFDIWLFKTDRTGNIEWSRTFGGPDSDVGRFVIQTRDSGFVLTGSTKSNNGKHAIWLIKTNAEGEQEWAQTFVDGNASFADVVLPASDGGYLLAGSAETSEDRSRVALVVKTDSDGAVQWKRTFKRPEGSISSVSVLEETNGTYLLRCGIKTKGGITENYTWILKFKPVFR